MHHKTKRKPLCSARHFLLYLVYNSVILVFNAKETAFVFLLFSLVPGGIFFYFLMDKTIVKDGWLYRNGFLRKNCKIRLTDITQMKRKKNLFGEALILYKNQKKSLKFLPEIEMWTGCK